MKRFFLMLLIPVLLLSGCSHEKNLVTEEGQTINMRSISNARELGGYKTIDGKTVRKGVLLRSAALTDASQEELDYLIRDYKLSAVIDMRASYELAEEPEPVLDGVAQYNFKIMDEQMMAQRAAGIYQVLKDPNVDPVTRMTAILDAGVISDQMYVEFLQGETGKTGFRDFFRVLLETPEGSSVLWHCTNGKDRTGVAAMLLLGVLNVDEETIMDDYMLTNEYRRSLLEGVYDSHRLLDRMSTNAHAFFTIQQGVIRSGAESMLEAIYRRYPDTDTFLEKEYGIGPLEKKHLKELYTVERR